MLATFDIVILAVILLAAIRGAIKGFVWQLAVIGSILLCFAFSETGSIYIAPLLPVAPPLNRWVAMLILYVVLSFAAFGIARMLHNWVEQLKLKEYDRHLGFVFGGIKGIIFCLVGTFFVVTLSDGYRQSVMNSKSGQAAAIIMDRLHPVMPDELHDVLAPYIHQLDHDGLDLKYSDHEHDEDYEEGDYHGHDDAKDHDADNLIERLLKGVQGETDEGTLVLSRLLKQAYDRTAPDDRAEFLEKLKSAPPERLRDVAEGWRNGKPIAETELPGFEDGFDDVESEGLLNEIVETFDAGPEASASIAEVVLDQLSGVPDRVARDVLRDWRADLKGISPDPNPETDASMSLDARIIAQLRKSGVPLNSLSRNLQERLRETLR